MTYIAGYPGHTSGPNGVITRIVLHGTVSPCVPGGARNVAAYFQEPTSGGLAHYVVDPSEVVQCCADDVAAWHAPPNHGSIGVELCDPQTGDAARWKDPNHTAMLNRAAALVADLCRRHNVPAVYVDAQGLLAGKRGVTTHHDVSNAWHQSTHTDPGDTFPLAAFIAQVAAHLAPPPQPPTPPLEARMLFLLKYNGQVWVTDVFERKVISTGLEKILVAQGIKYLPLGGTEAAAIREVQ